MINGGFIGDSQVNGHFAEDEEAYQLWLRDPSARVGHTVELGYHGDSATYPSYGARTLYLSDCEIDGYRDRIETLPSFTRAIGEELGGPINDSIGELELDNTDGALDLWHNLAFDGQSCRVRHGDPLNWLPERFRLVNDVLAEAVTKATHERLTIRLRGLEHGANKPLQTSLIASQVGATAPSNLPIPKAYGQVFNARPAVIDEVNQVHQVNDGAITSMSNVRDGGIAFRTNLIAISAVNTGTETLSTATAHGFVEDTRFRCDVSTLPSVSGWNGIVWTGTYFFAISDRSDLSGAYSVDGVNWSSRTLPFIPISLGWNGSVLCIIEEAAGAGRTATSKDGGTTWTTGGSITPGYYEKIVWNGTKFCTVGLGYTGTALRYAVSSDGVTWATGTIEALSSYQVRALAWNGTLFALAAYNSNVGYTSTDGTTWTARTLSATANWIGMVWTGSVFSLIAGNTSNVAATSADGITWTARTLPSSDTWHAIAWSGSTLCILARNSGVAKAATSPDGINWTAQTMPANAEWDSLAWNGYAFCAIAHDSAYTTLSADGSIWNGISNTLPAGLSINTDYWVIAAGLTTTDFRLSATRGGSAINITGSTTGAVVYGFHWTIELTTGKLYLDSKPASEITCDFVAGTTAASSIIPTVLGTINVDGRSQTRFASTCAQPIGVYVPDRRNRLDIAGDIVSGLGAWHGYSRFGFLQMGRIEGTPTTHDYEITADMMEDGSLTIERMVLPRKRHRIGYRRNWTDQSGKLLAGVSTEARNLYSQEYSASPPTLGTDEGSDGSQFHKLAVLPDVIPSLMVYGSDALTEGLRRDAMFFGWGAIFVCRVGLVGRELDPGMVVKVTHSRYGLTSGVRMSLIHVADRLSEGATELKFFCALSAYTPGAL